MINIVDNLEAYAVIQDYHFIFGSEDYINADLHKYNDGEVVMAVDLVEEVINYPDARNLSDGNNTYNYIIFFGRKFEDYQEATESNLDETLKQKHDRRLKELKALALSDLKAFACANNVGIQSIRIRYIPNAFKDNIDYVECDTTFIER